LKYNRKRKSRKRKRASIHQGVTCLQKVFSKARSAPPFFLLFPSQDRRTKAQAREENWLRKETWPLQG